MADGIASERKVLAIWRVEPEKEGRVKPMFEFVLRKEYKDIMGSNNISRTILKFQRNEENEHV